MTSERLRDQYDWIVIGDHPGALLSGALAARLGLSVLILPTVALSGGTSTLVSVSRSGQCRDPESNTLMGVIPPRLSSVGGGLLGLCLEHLGLLPPEAERLSVDEALPQVVTPSTRFSLHADTESLGAEYDREFGTKASGGWLTAREHAAPIIREFWLNYPELLTFDPAKKTKGLRNARSLEALVASLSKLKSAPRDEAGWYSPTLKSSDLARTLSRSGTDDLPEIAAGLYCGVTGISDPDPRALDFLHAIASNAATGRFRGGLTAYRELLFRMAKRLGANIPEAAECRRVFVEGGRLVGVQASHHGNMIAATGAAVGCSIEHLHKITTVGRRSLLKRLKPALTPTGWSFTLALTVHEEAIPPGVSSRTIWKERAAPALEIEIVNPSDYGQAERGSRFLFIRTLLPFTAESLQPSYQRLAAARMFRQVTELLPFLEFHVKRAYPDFRPDGAESAESEFTEAYPFRSLAEIPENLRGYAGEGVGSRSGIEGLFIVSGESFPRYGSLGGTVAALEGAAWLAHRCGLAGPMLQRPLSEILAPHSDRQPPPATETRPK